MIKHYSLQSFDADFDRYGYLSRLAVTSDHDFNSDIHVLMTSPVTYDHLLLFSHAYDRFTKQFKGRVECSVYTTVVQDIHGSSISDVIIDGSVTPTYLNPLCPHCSTPLKVFYNRLRCMSTTCPHVTAERFDWLSRHIPLCQSNWDFDSVMTGLKDSMITIPQLFDINDFQVSDLFSGRAVQKDVIRSLDPDDPQTVFNIIQGLSIPGLTERSLQHAIYTALAQTEPTLIRKTLLQTVTTSSLYSQHPVENELRLPIIREAQQIANLLPSFTESYL